MATLRNSNSDQDILQFFPGIKALRDEIAEANRAVVAVIQSVADRGDPALAALFGIEPGAMADLQRARSSDFNEAIRSGVPLFSLRFTHPDVLSALRHDLGADSVLQALLRSMPTPEVPRGA
ncbi:hypothetical protein GALL_523000 [mine drainage metagenome]|uniref:Uncharacterized protein n=1 Tax=mine drainage metagenome TaxID=410659 RepID=A0A1J5P4N7_9ZZZZ